MQPVQQQQVRDELVAGERRGQRAVVALGDVADHAREPLAVEVEQACTSSVAVVARGRVGEALDLLQQRPRSRSAARRRSSVLPRTSASAPGWSVLPSPRYMCTPHGRHGSKRPHRAHDVDAAEVVLPVLLEDRLPMHRVLVRARACRRSRSGCRSTASAGTGGSWRSCRRGSPGGARARRAPPRGSRSRSPRRGRRSPRTPSCGPARISLERLVEEVQRHAGRVGDEVDPRAVALDRVRPLRDLPLERRSRACSASSAASIFTLVAGRLHVRRVDLVGERRRPQPRERAAAGVERQVVARALVVPARAHHPGVVAAVEVALLRLRDRRLVPRVALVDRVAERVLVDERLLARPSPRSRSCRAGCGCRG